MNGGLTVSRRAEKMENIFTCENYFWCSYFSNSKDRSLLINHNKLGTACNFSRVYKSTSTYCYVSLVNNKLWFFLLIPFKCVRRFSWNTWINRQAENEKKSENVLNYNFFSIMMVNRFRYIHMYRIYVGICFCT